MLGDSITAEFPTDRLLKGYDIINKGIHGDKTDSVLDRLDSDVIALKPSAVFILIGINDFTSSLSNDRILVNVERIILRLMKGIPGVALFIQSLTPTRSLRNIPVDRIQIFNIELHKLALRYGARYVDIYPLFLDEAGVLSEEYSDDGLHLKEGGYRKWADYLKQVFTTIS